VGGANNTHTQTDTSSSVCTHTYTNISTDPNQLIHRLIHSPARLETQNHTQRKTLIDILRAGGLGIPPVVCGAVWHGVGVVGCAGAGVRGSITLCDPLPTLDDARQQARGRRNVSGAVCRLRCGFGGGVVWMWLRSGMVKARRRGLRAGLRSVRLVALWVCWVSSCGRA